MNHPFPMLLWKSFLRSSVVVGIAMGLLGWVCLVGEQETNFEEAAFGNATISVYANFDNRRIHCRDLRDANECIQSLVNSDARIVGVWMGNSMLHAINQYSAGQVTGPYLLHQTLMTDGVDLLTFSQPNANLQEHFLLFEYLATRLKIEVLILPVVFDDMREDGVRPDIEGVLEDSAVLRMINRSEIGRDLVARYSASSGLNNADMAGVAGTIQEHSEKYLNSFLEQHSRLWARRPEFRGELFVGLYNLRNSLLGINPSSRRRIIPVRYQRNMAALNALLANAVTRGIQVLVYIPPIRHDAEWPYVLSEYESFKTEVMQAASRHGAATANFEKAVPDTYWGMKDATNSRGGVELDFMHFQATGHELLAKSLARALREKEIAGGRR